MVTAKEKEDIFIARSKAKYPAVWAHYCEHVAHEMMTPDELREYNFRKRKKIVRYAFENTPFYHDLYSSVGFEPGDLKSEDDWNALPTITKPQVRQNFNAMLVGGEEGLLVKQYGKVCNTGGSTGVPLKLIEDTRYDMPGSTVWRSRGWWLGRPRGQLTGNIPVLGQNEAIIWRTKGVNVKTPEQKNAEVAEYWPTRRFYLDAQDMSDANIAQFVKECQEDGIVFLRGYAGALVEFAKYCRGACRPRAVSVVSSPIDAIGRRIITESLGCPVYDCYGAKECYNMAHECPQSNNNLHVLSDMRHIDILDEAGNPVVGEAEGVTHITSFTNFIMPMIRYRLGDMAHWIGQCSCGLPFPLISRIRGRETEHLIDKFGRVFFAPETPCLLRPNCIEGYQFVQHSPGVITIRMILNRSHVDFEKDFAFVKQFYADNFAGRFDYKYEFVNTIAHDGGKTRCIVQEPKNVV